MIELSSQQELAIERRDRRFWIGRMAEEWYTADNPSAENYPVEDFLHHMGAVFRTCKRVGLESIEATSMLGFNVLRANVLGYSAQSVEAMVDFFLRYAASGNIGYAQRWIDLSLEGE